MTVRVQFTRAALREARDARFAYQDRAPETVVGFRERLREARKTLAEFPAAGTEIQPGVRRLPLAPYPYSLVYRVSPEETVEVFAVPPQSNHPTGRIDSVPTHHNFLPFCVIST